ncbi:porin family protein [Leucothrix sargassi]|nr:porin family protein [Leucothrix sargassi]
MKKVLIGSALLLSVAATSAFAAPKWDQITGTYSAFDIDFDGFKVDFTGFGLSGTKLVTPNLFVEGSLSTVSEDETGDELLSFNELSLGLGYRHSISATTDIFGVVSYEDAEVEAEDETASESGYGLKAGIRSMVSPKVELAAEVKYVDIEDVDNATFAVSGDYFFTPQFSVGASYSTGLNVFSELIEEDFNTLNFSASYSF